MVALDSYERLQIRRPKERNQDLYETFLVANRLRMTEFYSDKSTIFINTLWHWIGYKFLLVGTIFYIARINTVPCLFIATLFLYLPREFYSDKSIIFINTLWHWIGYKFLLVGTIFYIARINTVPCLFTATLFLYLPREFYSDKSIIFINTFWHWI